MCAHNLCPATRLQGETDAERFKRLALASMSTIEPRFATFDLGLINDRAAMRDQLNSVAEDYSPVYGDMDSVFVLTRTNGMKAPLYADCDGDDALVIPASPPRREDIPPSGTFKSRRIAGRVKKEKYAKSSR